MRTALVALAALCANEAYAEEAPYQTEQLPLPYELESAERDSSAWGRFWAGEGEQLFLSVAELPLGEQSQLRLWYLETEWPEIASRPPQGYKGEEAVVVQYVFEW